MSESLYVVLPNIATGVFVIIGLLLVSLESKSVKGPGNFLHCYARSLPDGRSTP